MYGGGGGSAIEVMTGLTGEYSSGSFITTAGNALTIYVGGGGGASYYSGGGGGSGYYGGGGGGGGGSYYDASGGGGGSSAIIDSGMGLVACADGGEGGNGGGGGASCSGGGAAGTGDYAGAPGSLYNGGNGYGGAAAGGYAGGLGGAEATGGYGCGGSGTCGGGGAGGGGGGYGGGGGAAGENPGTSGAGGSSGGNAYIYLAGSGGVGGDNGNGGSWSGGYGGDGGDVSITLSDAYKQLAAMPDPFALSNTVIEVGQTSVANTVISNAVSGGTPYTGNWLWYPPASSGITSGNTIIASLPTTNNALTLTITAASTNTLQLTFNGLTYNVVAPGTNTIYGKWTFNAIASDENGDTNPTPQLTNSLTITSPCGAVPSTLIVACIPANIVNSQPSAATPTGFQQMFNALPFNALAGNVVVYNAVSGESMPAWVESNSIIWVNFLGNTISASSSANGVYYFGLGTSGTNFFISGNNIGEAPQLSCNNPSNTMSGCAAGQYGEYDNGNSVFSFYDNFVGTSDSKWAKGTGTDGSVTINNCLVVVSTGSTQTVMQTVSPIVTQNSIPETYSEVSTALSSEDNLGLGIVDANENSNTNGYFNFYAGATAFDTYYREGINWVIGTLGYATGYSNNVFYILGIVRQGDSVTPEVNYATYTTGAATFSPTANLYAIVNRLWIEPTLDTGAVLYQWVRVRAYPPGSAMPLVTYGATQIVPAQLVATPNPYTLSNAVIDVGQSSTANTVISGGSVTSYAGNWLWYPPSSSNIVAGNTITVSLPAANNALTLTIAAVSANTFQLTFGELTYTVTASGINTIYGTWTFNPIVSDAHNDINPMPRLTGTILVMPTCGTVPSNLIVSCFPAEIVNGQSLSTPAEFQQEFNALPFNALAGNVVVYNGISGALMPAWVESNSIIWVNLGTNTIAASSSANNIYYFGIGSSSTNFFIGGNNIGEAPQLSSTYAEYDNGASVFPYYQAWGGLSTPTFPSGWTTVGSPTINYYATYMEFIGSGAENVHTYIYRSYSATPPYAFDWFGNPYYSGLNAGSFVGFSDGLLTGSQFVDGVGGGNPNSGSTYYLGESALPDGRTFNSAAPVANQNNVYTQLLLSPTSQEGELNYGSGGTVTTSQSASSTNYLSLGTFSGVGVASALYIYWMRTRVCPPNGVMPAVSFGAQQSTTVTSNHLMAGPNPYTLSSTAIGVGQSSVANTVISNAISGRTPYTGNWIWFPPASSGISSGNTVVAPLPTANNALTLTINAVSANTLQLTFNGFTYNLVAPGTDTIYGKWTFNAVAGDAGGDIAPTPQLTNSLTIAAPATPGSILYKVPIKINNAQATAYPSNAQLPIPFNALAYQAYESNSLNNTEFFYYNGTAIPSWLEGNTLNESKAASTLSKSANVLFWIRIYPSNTFLCASCSNTIYLGFASKTTNLMGNTLTGEAPQLSPSYGLYDNGAKVFTVYDNFAGSSLNSALWGTTEQSSGTYAVSSGLTLTAASGSSVVALYTKNTYNAPLYTDAYMVSFSGTPDPFIQEATSNTLNGCIEFENGYSIDEAVASATSGTETFQSQTSSGCGSAIKSLTTGFHSGAWSLGWTSSAKEVASDSINNFTGTLSSITYGNYKGSIGLSNDGSGGTVKVQWFRMRSAVPNGAVPTVTFNAAGLVSASNTLSLSPSTQTVFSGQSVTFTNATTGGAPPFTFGYDVFQFGAPASSGNYVLLPGNKIEFTNAGTYNVMETDSDTNGQSTVSANSVITVLAPITLTMSQRYGTLDSGLSDTYTISESGGTGPFTVELYNVSGSSQQGSNVMILSPGGINSITLKTGAAGTFTYNAVGTDLGTAGAYPVNSLSNTLIVVNALSSPTISPSNPTIDGSQSVSFSSTWYNGATSYTANMYSSPALPCNSVSGSTLVQAQSSLTTANMLFNPVTPLSTTYYCIFVTDSGSNSVTMNSVTSKVSVSSQPSASLTASNTLIDIGQYVTLNAVIASGTGPFTVNFVNDAGSSVVNTLSMHADGIGKYTFQPSSSGTYNAIITDLGTASPYVFSSLQVSFTANAAPTVTLSPSNTVLNTGQTETFNAQLNNGIGPFTVNFIYANNGVVAHTQASVPFNGAGQYTFTASGTGMQGFYATATDAGTNTPYQASSATNTIIERFLQVCSAASGLGCTFTVTNFTMDVGQSSFIAVNGFVSTGIPPYSANWIFKSANTLPATQNTMLFNPGTQYTLQINPTSNSNLALGFNGQTENIAPISGHTVLGPWLFNGFIQDYSTFNTVLIDVPTITINPSLVAPSISSPSAANSLDLGQSIEIVSSAGSGGTRPYSYGFAAQKASGTCTAPATISLPYSAATSYLFDPNSTEVGCAYTFTSAVQDSASTPSVSTSAPSPSMTVSSAPALTISPSNSTLDSGQTETYTIYESGGTGPFTIELYNVSGTRQQGSNVIITSPGESSSITFNSGATGSFTYNAIGTDLGSVTPYVFNSTSNAIAVAAPISVSAISPSNPTINSGQTVSFSLTWTGGTEPYTAKLYSSPTSTCNAGSTLVQAESARASGSASFSPVSPNSLTYYCITVTDSASAATTANSAASAVSVNQLPSLALLPASKSVLVGGSAIFTNTTSGGTAPFTFTYSVFQFGAPASSANYLTTGNSIAFNGNGIYQVAETAVDSLGTSVTSANSVITVVSQPTLTISPSSAAVDYGQSVTFTNSTTGGLQPFAFAYNVLQFGALASPANCLTVGNATTFNNIGTYNVVEMLVDSLGAAATSENSVITVNALPAITASASTSNLIDAGQSVAFSNSSSSGTPPYTFAYEVLQSGVLVSAANYTVVGNSITFNHAGTYNVVETLTDAAGSIAYSQNIIVSVNRMLSVPSISPASASSVDAGQSVKFTADVFNGTKPYSYNFLIYNSLSGALVANALYNGITSDANAFVLTTNSNLVGIPLVANVVVTDALSAPETQNSIDSGTVAVNSGLGSSITASNSMVDADQYESLGALETGGSGPYTYSFYVYNPSGTLVYSALDSGSNTLLVQQSGTWGAGTFAANIVVTDSTKATSSSTTGYAASQPLVLTSFTASNSMASPPQYQTLTAYVSGGTFTPHYTYNIVVYNALGIPTGENDLYSSGTVPGTFTFDMPTNTAWPAGYYLANIMVTDSATSPSNVVGSVDFLECPGVVASISASNAVLDLNQYQTFNVVVLGCAQPYIYNYTISGPAGLVYNSITSMDALSNALTLPALLTGTYTANVVVTDSETTPTNSLSTVVYRVNSQPTVSIAPSAESVDSSQNAILTASPSGGTPPYSYQWYSSVSGNPACASADAIANAISSTLQTVPGATSDYTVQVTDSAATPVSACSSPSVVAVNPTLSSPAVSPTNIVYDLGDTMALAGAWSGGTSAYSANMTVFLDGAPVYNSLSTSSGNSITIQAPTNSFGTGTFDAVINVTDGSLSPESANSMSATITVNPQPAVGLSANGGSFHPGDLLELNVTVTGGTGPFEVEIYNETGGTQLGGNIVLASSGDSNTVTLTAGASAGALVYSAIATDMGTTYYSTFNSNKLNILLKAPAPTATQPTSGGHGSTTTVNTTSTTTSTITSTTIATTTIPPTTTIPQQLTTTNMTVTGSTTVAQGCSGANGGSYKIDYPRLGSTFTVNPGVSRCFAISAVNITAAPNQTVPSNLTEIIALNVTVNESAAVNATVHYPCSIPSSRIAPFILRNGSAWSAITPFEVDAASCAVTFAVPSDPVVGLFEVPASSVTSAIPVVSKASEIRNGILYAAVAVIVLLLVLAIAFHRHKRRRRWPRLHRFRN
jgi:plastocyanin